MALKLLQSGIQPLGQFDGVDSEYLTLKGGEVLSFRKVPVPGTDLIAGDGYSDGYVQNGTARTVVGFVEAAASLAVTAPLMLADEGVAGYGTLFGTVVGGVAGQITTGGAVLGPHTATGSGKVTCWDKPGLYAVSLDACDVGANSTLNPGDALNAFDSTSATNAGQLTDTSGAGIVDNVASFVSFESNGSLVNTPNRLVAALNSPSGSGSVLGQFQYMVIHFHGRAL